MAIIERLRKRPIVIRIQERIRRLPFFEKVGVVPEKLTPAQKALMEKLRRGIADALEVPPEAVREELLERWIVQWTKAWIKPEYWIRTDIAYDLGYHLGTILKESKSGAKY